jgi:hypothetical protein
MMKIITMLIVLTIIVSCSYSVYTNSYPHLKTVNIIPFENETTEYELEENLNNKLTEYFEDDGRLKITTISSDCRITGQISDYSKDIHTYSGSEVDEYQVRILFKIEFADLTNNKVIWKNDTLKISETFSATNENIEFKTEEEAQEEIISKLFETIMKNSLEQW